MLKKKKIQLYAKHTLRTNENQGKGTELDEETREVLRLTKASYLSGLLTSANFCLGKYPGHLFPGSGWFFSFMQKPQYTELSISSFLA